MRYVGLRGIKAALRFANGRFTVASAEPLEEHMAVGILATIKIKEGTNEAF